MKKYIAMLLILTLAVGVMTGCTGTTVIYNDCTCGDSGIHETTPAPETTAPAVGDGTPVKTGLAVLATAEGTNAAADADGSVVYDVTYVAVNVDDNGIITACVIDSLKATLNFTAGGTISTDLSAQVLTKNELGPDYGMVAWGNAVAEWDEQAAALAAFAVGKTYDQFLAAAIDETGYAADADLATSATIYLGSYVQAVGEAVNNATHLGAQSGDELKLVTINSLSGSTAATAEEAGSSSLTSDVAAVTMNGEIITSCAIDALQAAVSFDASGVITSDLSSGFATKNQLGFDYGMVAYAGAKYEWFEQAANFSAYVCGKTAAEVAGIAIGEGGKPADADLATSVTIAIGGFQALIAKAAQ